MNEEVSDKSIHLAIRTSQVSVRVLIRGLMWMERHHHHKKMEKKMKNVHPKGKQSLKQLIDQNQGVSSMDIGDQGIKDFQKLANKYGVDFAIVKDKGVKPAKYTVFFKARDADAITQVLKEYAEKQVKRNKNLEKPSVLQKLKNLKELVANVVRKQRDRWREPER